MLFFIWFGSGVMIAGFWFLDGHFDINIGYGKANAFCFLNESESLRNLVIIPGGITIIGNVACLIYSARHYSRTIDDASSKFRTSLIMFFKFMVMILTFQICQWALGLAYHVWPNEILGLIFECLTAFEGVYFLVFLYAKQFLRTAIESCKFENPED